MTIGTLVSTSCISSCPWCFWPRSSSWKRYLSSACWERRSQCVGHRGTFIHPGDLPSFYSLSLWGRPPLRHRTDLPVRYQHTHMPGNEWQDQRSLIRDTLHPPCSRDDLGLLEQHNGRYLADARLRRYVHLMTAAGGFLLFF